MLVCHCRAVSDRVIRQCVRAGNTSLEGIGECTGAGTGCGGCHDAILDIVDDEAELPSVGAAAPGQRRLPLILSEVA